MTRLFTEALGRGPEPAAWKGNALFTAQPSNCTSLDFAAIANGIYSSAEYNALGYTNMEKVITLYRGLLNREPDSYATLQYWTNILNDGNPLSLLVSNFVSQQEFTNLRNNQICTVAALKTDSVYKWGYTAAIDTGAGSMSAAQLNAALAAAAASANKTVSLAQRTVVFADQPISIPAGVTLTTSGGIARNRYVKMARIVRTAAFASPMVTVNSGGAINGMWLSGQRDHAINGITMGYTELAANVAIRSGANSSVVGSRLDTNLGNTNIAVDGAEATGGIACSGAVVHNNLITGYSNTHYPIGGAYKLSDGITVKCPDTSVTSNTIVDASDVGIIMFYSAGAGQTTQHSVATNNALIAAGVPSYAGMMFEPYFSSGPSGGTATPVHMDFSGARFEQNIFYGATDTHFDLGASLGAKPWNRQTMTVNGVTYPLKDNTAFGGHFINNSNEGIGTRMQAGIGVDGMPQTTVNNNKLNYLQLGFGNCVKGTLVTDTAYETSLVNGVAQSLQQSTPSLITSNLQNGGAVNATVGNLNSCQMGSH